MDQQLWLTLVTGLMGVLVLMFGAMFKRLFSRQDELEKSKANASSTDKRFEALLAEMKEQRQDFKAHQSEDKDMHRDVLNELRAMGQNIAQTNANVARIVGRFEAQNGS